MTTKEAIEIIRGELGNSIIPYSDEMEAFGMAIEALQGFQPKRGHWYRHKMVDGTMMDKCDACGGLSQLMYDFCPFCGAEMYVGRG